jgi:hypothetical protein
MPLSGSERKAIRIGQARYREAAIQTSLMLRTAFTLVLRQTEGLIAIWR